MIGNRCKKHLNFLAFGKILRAFFYVDAKKSAQDLRFSLVYGA